MQRLKPIAIEDLRPRTPTQKHAAEKNIPGPRIAPWQYIAILIFACSIVIARRPDAVSHAQFYTEDGKVWFSDAYNLGWGTALFRAYHGCFEFLPRLGAALSLLVPFAVAPLVLNLIAIALQAIPVLILLSPRSSAWGRLRFRIFLAAMYLALPNCGEINAGIACSMWVLALIAFLLLVASQPRNVGVRLLDLSLLLLCGLTGPFCILLLPIALFLLWTRRSHWQWAAVVVLSITCLVQAWALLIRDPAGRDHVALGASPSWFIRILGGQVYLGTLLGGNQISLRPGQSFLIFLACVAIGGTVIIAICLAKSNVEMKLFLLFSAAILAVSLLSPKAQPPGGMSVWNLLAAAPQSHYWFFPTLAFAWSLVWCLNSRIQLLQIAAAALLLLMFVGFFRDWRYHAFDDLQFANHAKRLAAAPQGAVILIPINPPGWRMELIKR
jgi:hypothetical protein